MNPKHPKESVPFCNQLSHNIREDGSCVFCDAHKTNKDAAVKPTIQTELLPCPFCGGKAGMDTIRGDFLVSCSDCGNQTDIRLDDYEAVELWNTRNSELERKYSRLKAFVDSLRDTGDYLCCPGRNFYSNYTGFEIRDAKNDETLAFGNTLSEAVEKLSAL